jgi:hypothetical protein
MVSHTRLLCSRISPRARTREFCFFLGEKSLLDFILLYDNIRANIFGLEFMPKLVDDADF